MKAYDGGGAGADLVADFGFGGSGAQGSEMGCLVDVKKRSDGWILYLQRGVIRGLRCAGRLRYIWKGKPVEDSGPSVWGCERSGGLALEM